MSKKFKIFVLMMALSLGTGLVAASQSFSVENERPRLMEYEKGPRPGGGAGMGMKQEMGAGLRGPGGMGMERPGDRMEKELNMNAEQKTQIKAIHEKERVVTAPLVKKLQDIMEKIDAAATAEPFDEKAVRVLAESQAAIQADLTVARIRTQSQVNAILTPEQRTKAEKLRSEQRKMHRPPEGPQGNFPAPPQR